MWCIFFFFFSSVLLLQPLRPLKATATTSQPVLTMQQIDTIFYKIQDILEIHKEFFDALLPSIQQWDEKVTVGHLFKKLVSLTRPRQSPSSFTGNMQTAFERELLELHESLVNDFPRKWLCVVHPVFILTACTQVLQPLTVVPKTCSYSIIMEQHRCVCV